MKQYFNSGFWGGVVVGISPFVGMGAGWWLVSTTIGQMFLSMLSMLGGIMIGSRFVAKLWGNYENHR